MFGKDIKVGTKVVPVIKTIEGPLSKSKEWARAKEQGRKFLTVNAIIDKPGKKLVYVAGAGKTGGDRFAAIDLRAHPWTGWDCRKAGAKPAKKAAPKKAAPKKAAPKKAARVEPVAVVETAAE